jgi:N-acetylneuraminic acid mutarotase
MKTSNRHLLSGVYAFSVFLFFLVISRGQAQEYTWTELNTMIDPAAAHAACFNNGKLFALGGTDKSMHGNQYGEAWIQIYNAESDSWSQGSPMQFPRMMLGAAQVNGIIYAIGGG